ncbi:hypothetical protein C9374_006460 [Naegleria lovaniensis]|uniref:ADP,ATP carrier protein n=1 Tax=Naegleria lovaniensis TaxID=51637 RepID=A0AA88KMH8_NAELO|nr:uncharacterized protein C9374_006460 [Naegleria lovaniensis]KAG2381471.1 hypothetical protein C9374_006460 [Naegleria lovaniensis]
MNTLSREDILFQAATRFVCYPLSRVQTIQQSGVLGQGAESGIFQVVLKVASKPPCSGTAAHNDDENDLKTAKQNRIVSVLKKINFSSFWKGFDAHLLAILIRLSKIAPRIRSVIFSKLNNSIYLPIIFDPLFTYPFEMARVKLASDTSPQNRNVIQVLSKVINNTGLAGLFRGYHLHILGIALHQVAYFTGYSLLGSIVPVKKDSFMGALVVSNIASTFSSLFTYPIVTIMRRLQLEAAEDEQKTSSQGTIQTAKNIIQKEGVAALYSGFPLLVCHSTLAPLTLMFLDMAYDYISKKFK